MFIFTTIEEFHSQLKNETISCSEVVEKYLRTIKEKKQLNAFIEVYEKEALEKAAALDVQLKTGIAMKKLHGVVIAIKDVICYKDHKVTAASNILKGFTSLYTSTALQYLIDEDAIIIGNCNCDEFAMGSSNENSAYGKVLNGLNETKVPGGSSGGSAVAVQMDMCMLALGSDTGGSVRQPADFCGIVGLKPGYGTISRYGLIAYASSFDQIGIFGKNIEDVALFLNIMARSDVKDSTMNLHQPVIDYTKNAHRKYKIAFLNQAVNNSIIDPEIAQKINSLQNDLIKQGNVANSIDLDLLDFVVPAYYVLTTAEASSNLGRYDGIRYGNISNVQNSELNEFYLNNRTEGFGWEVKRRIMLGTFVLSAGYYDTYFFKAQQIRRLLINKVLAIFMDYDVIVMPVSPVTAFNIGRNEIDPIATYMADIFTVFANLTGIPGIAVPLFSHSNNMPFGVQIMANKEQEVLLLEVAEMLSSFYK